MQRAYFNKESDIFYTKIYEHKLTEITISN